MTRRIYIIAIIAGLILCSCISKKEQNAAADIATVIGGTKYEIQHGKAWSTGEGSHNTMDLTFSGVDIGDAEEWRATSTAAYLFFKAAPPIESNYDRIDVTIKGKGPEYERKYAINDLAVIDSAVTTVDHFFKTYYIDSLREMIDPRWFRDSDVVTLHDLKYRLDSICGDMTYMALRGFELRTSEVNKEPIVNMWFVGSNDKYEGMFNFTILKRDRKIGHFEIVGVKPKGK